MEGGDRIRIESWLATLLLPLFAPVPTTRAFAPTFNAWWRDGDLFIPPARIRCDGKVQRALITRQVTFIRAVCSQPSVLFQGSPYRLLFF